MHSACSRLLSDAYMLLAWCCRSRISWFSTTVPETQFVEGDPVYTTAPELHCKLRGGFMIPCKHLPLRETWRTNLDCRSCRVTHDVCIDYRGNLPVYQLKFIRRCRNCNGSILSRIPLATCDEPPDAKCDNHVPNCCLHNYGIMTL